MSIYKPTWLYIKQHSITGLKYFGKTTKDPHTYLGSGKYWKRHIRHHGTEHVVTLWCEMFLDVDSLQKYAIEFSTNNKIVESSEWANLMIENGLDGSLAGRKMSAESRQKMSKNGAPAKDSVTGKRLGKVSKDDPRWATKEVVHTSTGTKYTVEAKNKRSGWKQSVDACKLISESHKGVGNSQFGTTYMINHLTQQKTRIKKEKVECLLSQGWILGNKHSYTYVKITV